MKPITESEYKRILLNKMISNKKHLIQLMKDQDVSSIDEIKGVTIGSLNRELEIFEKELEEIS